MGRSSFDYVQYPWYGFLAGISQAENSEPGYGQGAAGYGKRFGAAFADGSIENFMTSAVFPSLLRQDPRFFQSGKGGFWHRTGYAMTRVIITRGDSGHSQANFSEVIGSALSQVFRRIATIPVRIETCGTPRVCGVRRSGTILSPTWSKNSGPTFAAKYARNSHIVRRALSINKP